MAIRRLFLFLSILGSITLLKSQQSLFDGGVSGGITGAQIDGDTYFGFRHLGFNAGAFTRVKFYEDLQLMLELRYCGRGATQLGTDENPSMYRMSLHYIDAPISAVAIFDKYHFNVGISPGLLLGYSQYDDAGKVPENKIDPFKNIDWGAFLGTGYAINERLWASLRYTYSLVPIRERTTFNSFNNYSFVGRVLNLQDGDFNNYLTITFYYRMNDE